MSGNKNKLDLSKNHSNDKGKFINNATIVENISKKIKMNVTTSVYIDLKKTEAKQTHTLHSAKGNENAGNGAYVFEFRTAGSGNNQWNKIYRGFNGHNEDIKLTPLDVQGLQEERSYYDEIANTMKQKYRLDFNKKITDEELAQNLEKEYGTPLYIDDKGVFKNKPADNTKMLSGVRIKKDVRYSQGGNNKKIVANLSGPLGSLAGTNMGIFNSGDYSIDNLKSYMLQLADLWLKEVKDEKEKTKDTNPVHIYMQGHSRGGVATAEASAMIQNLINTKYKELKDQIHISVRLYDPVPGTDAHSEHHTIDHKQAGFRVSGNNNASGIMNKEAKDRNDLTVLYSIHSNHDVNFKPMNVFGAKRIILSPRDHDMGIYDVGGSGDKLHKKGFINGADGDEYRGTGIHDLNEGLFVLDENNILVEIKNRQEAHMLLDSIYEDRSDYWQRSRHNTMYNVVDEWFTRHPEEITSKDTRYNPLEAIKKDIEVLKQCLDDAGAAVDPAIKSRAVASLLTHANILNRAQNDPLRLTREAYKKYKRMSEDPQYVTEFENGPVFKEFIKNLTDDKLREIVDHPSPTELVEQYKDILPAALPETGVDMVDKHLGQALAGLNSILNSELSDDPEKILADTENAKRFTVANILSNRLVNEAAKKDPEYNETVGKDKYSGLLRSADSNVIKIVKDSDFVRFYEKLTPDDIQSLASGGTAAADKILADYLATRDLSEPDKTFEDIGMLKKLNEDSFTDPARVCAMLKDDYKLEDIFNPHMFPDEKQKYLSMEFEDAAELASTAKLCKQKLYEEEPFAEGDSKESLTTEYIRAEEEKIKLTEMYKKGMQKALAYIDKKMLSMKSLNLSEIARPENRQLFVAAQFLKNLATEIGHTAPQYPAGDNRTAFVDPEIEELVARQSGFNSLISPITDKAVELNSKIANLEKIDVNDVLPQIVAQKANENIANDALKQAQTSGANFTDFVKRGSSTFAKCTETLHAEKLSQSEFKAYCRTYGDQELAKRAILKESMTNNAAFRNASRDCGKNTLKQITGELNNAIKQAPQRWAVI